MKRKYIFLSCALVAALIAGIAQAGSDQDAGKRRAGDSGKTVEIIFKTPPGGVVFEPDREIEIARIDTSSYRRIRIIVRSADMVHSGSPALVRVYDGELEFPLLDAGSDSTAIVDLPAEFIILRGIFSVDLGSTPHRIVVYGER